MDAAVNTALATDPTFSPDGMSLAFTQLEGNRSRLHVRDLNTGVDRPLTAPAYEPEWSNSGVIAFTRKTTERQADLFLIAPDGTGERRLTYRGGGNPDWSPDGRRLVYPMARACTFCARPGAVTRNVARRSISAQCRTGGQSQSLANPSEGGLRHVAPTAPLVEKAALWAAKRARCRAKCQWLLRASTYRRHQSEPLFSRRCDSC